jgi:hypothetical protein
MLISGLDALLIGGVAVDKALIGGVEVYASGGSPPAFVGYKNSFIGVASGTAVTIGNSGGTSGDAFTNISAAGSVVSNTSADLTTAYDRGAICTLAASQNAYAEFTHSDYASSWASRIYVRRSATPGVTQRVTRGYNGTSMLWEVRWQADGTIILANAGGTWISSTTGATALNTTYRIETLIQGSVGTMRVYLGESATAMTFVDDGAVPTAGVGDHTRFGLMTTSNQSMAIDISAVAVASSGWIGAAV